METSATKQFPFIDEFFESIQRWAQNCVENSCHTKSDFLERLDGAVEAWRENEGTFNKKKCGDYIKKDERHRVGKDISDEELRGKRILCGKGYPLCTSLGWLLHTLVSAVVIEVVNNKLRERRFDYDGPRPRSRKHEGPALYHIWEKGEKWVRVSFGQELPSKKRKPDVAICYGDKGDPKKDLGKVMTIVELKTYPAGGRKDYNKFVGDVRELEKELKDPKKSCIYIAKDKDNKLKAKQYNENGNVDNADEYPLHNFFKYVEEQLNQLR